MTVFEHMYDAWRKRSTENKRMASMAALAFHKDVKEALATKPSNLGEYLPMDFEHGTKLKLFIQSTCDFIAKRLIPELPLLRRKLVPVVSPSAGEDTPAAILEMADENKSQTQPLRMCCLNPGRLGFSDQDGSVLWWRLWEVAAYGAEHSIHIFVCPGPRWPHGITLPQGFPYCIVGQPMTTYESVVLLISVDFFDSFEILEDISSSSRRIWFKVKPRSGGRGLRACGFFAPPGGDVSFFRELVKEGETLGTFVAFGDANIHPRDLG